MYDWTSRAPFLIFTHSPCRGDLSNLALAQSWAWAAAGSRATASAMTRRHMGWPSWSGRPGAPGAGAAPGRIWKWASGRDRRRGTAPGLGDQRGPGADAAGGEQPP